MCLRTGFNSESDKKNHCTETTVNAARRSRNQSFVLVLVAVLESAGKLAAAVQRSNVRPACTLLWPKDFLLRNELNPAKKCWYVLWPRSRNWVERFDPYQYRVRENAPSMAGPFEHEE
jgi:hypothetical protein